MILHLNKTFWFSHKKKKTRKKNRKHLQKFFFTRKKKYLYYYKRCALLKLAPVQKIEKNVTLNHSKKKYNLGIKILGGGVITSLPLKSLKFVSQRFMRSRKIEKYFKHHVMATPDFQLTAKPKSVRMGKGKGATKKKVSFIKSGLVIYNIKYYFNYKKHSLHKQLFLLKLNIFLQLLISRLKTKLPNKTVIFKKSL